MHKEILLSSGTDTRAGNDHNCTAFINKTTDSYVLYNTSVCVIKIMLLIIMIIVIGLCMHKTYRNAIKQSSLYCSLYI